MMHGDRAAGDSHKFELPAELVSELQRRGTAPKVDMQMDHWKPSLLDRLFALFSKDSR
jgi:hypothetical protein